MKTPLKINFKFQKTNANNNKTITKQINVSLTEHDANNKELKVNLIDIREFIDLNKNSVSFKSFTEQMLLKKKSGNVKGL